MRIYAEDPDNEFLPATGQLNYLRQPQQSRHVRVDTGVRQNDEVSSFYDPMIAKLIVWDETRERAIARMLHALDEYRIGGLKTNLGFLTNLVGAEPFAQAQLNTGFIEKHTDLLFSPATDTSHRALALASLAILLGRQQHNKVASTQCNDPFSPWANTSGWRLNELPSHQLELTDQHGIAHFIHVTQNNDSYHFDFDNVKLTVSGQLSDDQLSATINGHKINLLLDQTDQHVSLFIKQDIHHFSIKGHGSTEFVSEEAESKLTAPMNGTIVSVMCQENQTVKAGDSLVIMEAMKMEYAITAPYDGTVTEIFYHDGDMVKDGQLLVEFEAQE